MIEVKNISLKYPSAENKKQYVLQDLSLTINKGQFVCLLGHSGCGKSSLLGLIAGFVQSSQGEICMDGKKILRPEINRTLVFQEYALFPWLNVIENVAFGLKYKIKNKEERFMLAARYLKMVGLLDHARDKVAELSGGMKQRVAIARSLVVKPDLLLMDEPFGALDEHTRVSMQKELTNIWLKLGTTIVFVTHSVDEAMILADRIIIIGKSNRKDVIGEIKADIEITSSRPRSLASLSAYRNQILDALYGQGLNNEALSFDAGI